MFLSVQISLDEITDINTKMFTDFVNLVRASAEYAEFSKLLSARFYIPNWSCGSFIEHSLHVVQYLFKYLFYSISNGKTTKLNCVRCYIVGAV
jgi:hypothetical protein